MHMEKIGLWKSCGGMQSPVTMFKPSMLNPRRVINSEQQEGEKKFEGERQLRLSQSMGEEKAKIREPLRAAGRATGRATNREGSARGNGTGGTPSFSLHANMETSGAIGPRPLREARPTFGPGVEEAPSVLSRPPGRMEPGAVGPGVGKTTWAKARAHDGTVHGVGLGHDSVGHEGLGLIVVGLGTSL
ncbi:hypothetical protein KC19_VG196700 [Ceratodon purpureus]|uniref:Uncharacterized protein n=1 Tax=Ceratodon purpureus TaxID=3225 RepID=A0A8T0HS70_CERPU|nr:hypothetical protein KC19_VG196700 [Ceratodon purpureus]